MFKKLTTLNQNELVKHPVHSQIYIGRNLSQSSKVELSCLGKESVSYGLGADFSLPHCLVPEGTGIRKQLGTISSWYKRSASRNLGVNRHGTTLRQRVQRYRYWLYFFSSFGICLSGGSKTYHVVGKLTTF